MCIGKGRLALKTGLQSKAQKHLLLTNMAPVQSTPKLASHAGVFRGARISSLSPKNACVGGYPKTGRVDNFRNRRNQNLKLPISYQRPQIKSTCQFLANSVRQCGSDFSIQFESCRQLLLKIFYQKRFVRQKSLWGNRTQFTKQASFPMQTASVSIAERWMITAICWQLNSVLTYLLLVGKMTRTRECELI